MLACTPAAVGVLDAYQHMARFLVLQQRRRRQPCVRQPSMYSMLSCQNASSINASIIHLPCSMVQLYKDMTKRKRLIERDYHPYRVIINKSLLRDGEGEALVLKCLADELVIPCDVAKRRIMLFREDDDSDDDDIPLDGSDGDSDDDV